MAKTGRKNETIVNVVKIDADIDAAAREAASACCATADRPIDWDGIPSRQPTPTENLLAEAAWLAHQERMRRKEKARAKG